MGEAVGHVRVQADVIQQFGHTLPVFPLVVDQSVDRQRLADDVPRSHARVQGAIRVLEYDLHLAAHGPHLVGASAGNFRAVEPDFAVGGTVEAQDAPAGGGLATAGLTHEPEGFAAHDGKVNVVHGLDVGHGPLEQDPRRNGEVHFQAAYVQQHVAVPRMRLGRLRHFGSRHR